MSIVRPAAGTAPARPQARPRQPDRSKAVAAKNTLRRERHQPDYLILVAVVALAAIGILMVFSSSAIREYLGRGADTMGAVGPQIQWAVLGIIAMVVMSRIDYRYLRLVSVPGYFAALAALILVLLLPEEGFLRSNIVGGSARWVQLGPLPAVHPAEFAKLALIVYFAHWMSRRGTDIRHFLGGTVAFLLLAGPPIALVFKEPDLGTTIVITVTLFSMFFVAGANMLHLAGMGVLAVAGVFYAGLKAYQIDRIRAFLDPWSDRLGDGFHTIQGLLALGLGGVFGAGLGESRLAGGLFLPNASNDFIFSIIGEEFGLIGGALVVFLFVVLGYAGIRTALRAPDTFGGLMAAGITAWLCLQAFINIGVVVALLPVTGITLPFISAGGSSLIISFAAVGILLSISRETIERGSWNDAPADRGRGHGRTHLPGAGRRPIASDAPAGRPRRR